MYEKRKENNSNNIKHQICNQTQWLCLFSSWHRWAVMCVCVRKMRKSLIWFDKYLGHGRESPLNYLIQFNVEWICSFFFRLHQRTALANPMTIFGNLSGTVHNGLTMAQWMHIVPLTKLHVKLVEGPKVFPSAFALAKFLSLSLSSALNISLSPKQCYNVVFFTCQISLEAEFVLFQLNLRKICATFSAVGESSTNRFNDSTKRYLFFFFTF